MLYMIIEEKYRGVHVEKMAEILEFYQDNGLFCRLVSVLVVCPIFLQRW